MRRPPGLWILLSAGVVWLSLQNAYGLRATSLIFGKTSTTTTTAKAIPEESEAAEDETVATTDVSNDPNSTKPTLTGNPQLDYIWDPNLPKELNGYNLSDYPFYERVPEDIDFKCDGLHDGFYASVAHKCQVYHHCLFGTRYDFLCANYTAFDQKTFICHFASEVDCANSKKFWHRNDALYKAATTTTVKPFVIYTTAPPQNLVTPSVTDYVAPPNPGLNRPIGGRRRPFRRRRPQFEYYDDEYYDDYYEERPRSHRGRNRPRVRPRPLYEDDYEDYDYETYERRGSGGGRRDEKRRPYDRRSGDRRRNKERIRDDYGDSATDEEFDEFQSSSLRKPNDREEADAVEEERQGGNRKRRPLNSRNEYGKPAYRNSQRRPVNDYYEDEPLDAVDSRGYERPRNSNQRIKAKDDTKTIVKPASGTIYDRPRVAPRIKLPVPKNQAEKYAYKPADVSPTVEKDEEYYDDYDEEELAPARKNLRESETVDRRRNRYTSKKQTPKRRPDRYIEEKDKTGSSRDKRPTVTEYYDEYDEVDGEEQEMPKTSAVRYDEKKSKPISSTAATVTSKVEGSIEKVEQPAVRLIKRPFLPSRGGNPYAARGLQPVGNKAIQQTPHKVLGENIKEDNADEETREPFKPSVMIGTSVGGDDLNSQTSKVYQSQALIGARPTEKPKVPEQIPLDINEEDYDVTFNDALNPTLPNLPVRASPTGFGQTTHFSYANAHHPRYNADSMGSSAHADYVFQTKPVRQPYQQQGGHFANSNLDFRGQYSNYRSRQVQQQTEVFYPRL